MTTDLKNILVRIKWGERDAFRTLYDAYAPLIFDLAVKILKDPALAEEVVQDCFVKIWTTRQEIRTENDIWPLLYVIAKRICFNQLRHERVAQTYLNQIEDIQINDVEQRVNARELEVQLDSSIERLPEQQKKALKLSRVEGYTHQQIALEMGISPNTVKNHITQALKNLKKALPKADYNFILFFIFFL